MRRYDICVIGSKGSGFTYVAYDLVEALSLLELGLWGGFSPNPTAQLAESGSSHPSWGGETRSTR